MESKVKKEITLESLAVSVDNVANSLQNLAIMTAKGFENVNERLDKVEGSLNKVEGRLDKVENEMAGLRSSVNRYLELSDKRYLELKARQDVIVSWVKQIGDKTGVKIDLTELEKVV